jgi:hypothetical protein
MPGTAWDGSQWEEGDGQLNEWSVAESVSEETARETGSWPEAPGAYLGHEPGDNRGQQRFLAGSRDLALTSANAREQQRPREPAVYGMQEVRRPQDRRR